MKQMLRFAMMGAGFIAGPNAAALVAQPGVRLVAISNPTLSKAARIANDTGSDCRLYADWRDMLEHETVDAVLINLPHFLHHEVFLACAARGLHVIIEKPLANTVAQCRDMIEAASRYGVRATVCHTQRYNAVFQAAKDYIASHDLGRLHAIEDNIHTHYFWDGRSPWQLSPEQSGGGIALNYGVHQLDRVHWFLQQKTVRFTAQYLTEKPGYIIPSSYMMLGVGERGTPYSISCSGYTGPDINEMRLVFERGILHCCLRDNGLVKAGLYTGDTTTRLFAAQPLSLLLDGFYHRQFAAAIDYLSGKTDEAPVPLEWAAEMVRLVTEGFAKDPA
jgi:predicted dehydrogenase